VLHLEFLYIDGFFLPVIHRFKNDDVGKAEKLGSHRQNFVKRLLDAISLCASTYRVFCWFYCLKRVSVAQS
jgi:hypothetical protein